MNILQSRNVYIDHISENAPRQHISVYFVPKKHFGFQLCFGSGSTCFKWGKDHTLSSIQTEVSRDVSVCDHLQKPQSLLILTMFLMANLNGWGSCNPDVLHPPGPLTCSSSHKWPTCLHDWEKYFITCLHNVYETGIFITWRGFPWVKSHSRIVIS